MTERERELLRLWLFEGQAGQMHVGPTLRVLARLALEAHKPSDELVEAEADGWITLHPKV